MKRKWLLIFTVILGIVVSGCSQEVEEEFVGTITEINGLTAIVLADEGEDIRNSGDLVEVSLSVSDNFEFMVGDRVRVTHKGPVQEKYPLGIETISVDLLERDENPQEEQEEQEEQKEEEDNSAYNMIREFLKEESIEAFSPYYELLEFRISDYHEEMVDGNVEAEFLYTIVSKNYDRDPDTAGYIKEAKESGNENYQLMYDEYLQPRDMNFDFKVVIDEQDNITLYSNVAPKGVEWEETKMTDYILTENTGFTGIGYDLDYKDKIFPGMSDKEVSAVISKILDAARQEADKGEDFQLTEEVLKEYGIEGLDPEYMDMLNIFEK